jgi:predicted HNH restriction endonuclease
MPSGLHFVIIKWKQGESSRMKGQWYLVLFPANRHGPLVEIWETKKDNIEQKSLYWNYSPSKRDGKNELRKAYFQKHFKNTRVVIDLPNSEDDLDGFLEECFILVDNRLKSDFLDKQLPMTRESFPEGKEHERRHIVRERNPKVVRLAKDLFKTKQKHLFCQVCSFDFAVVYGELGEDFIEAHHIIPVSALNAGVETRVEDIILICSNCHRMLHRKRPWVTTGKLKTILRKNTKDI